MSRPLAVIVLSLILATVGAGPAGAISGDLSGIGPTITYVETEHYLAVARYHAAAIARAARVARARRVTSSNSHAPTTTSGSFPGDCIYRHESASAGGYSAYNPTPTSNGHASGKYQITSGTWNGYGGYSDARSAPPAVQEAQAQSLWARNPHAWRGTNCPGTG